MYCTCTQHVSTWLWIEWLGLFLYRYFRDCNSRVSDYTLFNGFFGQICLASELFFVLFLHLLFRIIIIVIIAIFDKWCSESHLSHLVSVEITQRVKTCTPIPSKAVAIRGIWMVASISCAKINMHHTIHIVQFDGAGTGLQPLTNYRKLTQSYSK